MRKKERKEGRDKKNEYLKSGKETRRESMEKVGEIRGKIYV